MRHAKGAADESQNLLKQGHSIQPGIEIKVSYASGVITLGDLKLKGLQGHEFRFALYALRRLSHLFTITT